MESSCLVVRPGLDDSISDDGDGGLVDLETLWLGEGVGILRDSTCFERSLVTDFFRRATTRLGTGRYHCLVGGDCGDDHCVFSREWSGWWVDGALLGVGELCDGVELCFVEDELEDFLTTNFMITP